MDKITRLSLAIILALATTGLFSCAKGDVASSEPENSHTSQNGATEQNAMKQAQSVFINAPDRIGHSIFVAYESDRLVLTLNSNYTDADALWVMDLIAPILQGQVVCLTIRTADKTVLPLEQFTPYFDFASLDLDFDPGDCLNRATGVETLADVGCLSALDIGSTEPQILPTISQLETLKLAPYHKETGIPGTFSFAGLDNLPALRTLIVNDPYVKDIWFLDLDAVSRCAALRELRILSGNSINLATLGPNDPNSPRNYFLCEAALACPTLTTIQGQSASSFDLQAISIEGARESYRNQVNNALSNSTTELLQSVMARYPKGEINQMDSIPVLNAPFILSGIVNDGSIPDTYLRQTIEGGDVRYLVIVDSRSGEVVKTYTNGGKGYETITYFYIYDIEQDMVSPETIVAVTQPPDTIIGTSGSGDKQPQAALPYIVALLG